MARERSQKIWIFGVVAEVVVSFFDPYFLQKMKGLISRWKLKVERGSGLEEREIGEDEEEQKSAGWRWRWRE